MVLLVLCGVVFVYSPAGLLAKLTPDWMSSTLWAVIILVYYLLATLPASFMTAVSVTYILTAEEGFKIGLTPSYIAGGCAAAVLLTVYLVFLTRRIRRQPTE